MPEVMDAPSQADSSQEDTTPPIGNVTPQKQAPVSDKSPLMPWTTIKSYPEFQKLEPEAQQSLFQSYVAKASSYLTDVNTPRPALNAFRDNVVEEGKNLGVGFIFNPDGTPQTIGQRNAIMGQPTDSPDDANLPFTTKITPPDTGLGSELSRNLDALGGGIMSLFMHPVAGVAAKVWDLVTGTIPGASALDRGIAADQQIAKEQTVEQGGDTLGQKFSGLAGNLVTSFIGGPNILRMISLTAPSAVDETYHSALDQGSTPEQAAASAGVAGVVTAGILSVLGPLNKLGIGGVLGDNAEAFINGSYRPTVKEAASLMGLDAAGLFGTGYVGQVVQNKADQALYDPDRPTTQGAVEAGGQASLFALIHAPTLLKAFWDNRSTIAASATARSNALVSLDAAHAEGNPAKIAVAENAYAAASGAFEDTVKETAENAPDPTPEDAAEAKNITQANPVISNPLDAAIAKATQEAQKPSLPIVGEEPKTQPNAETSPPAPTPETPKPVQSDVANPAAKKEESVAPQSGEQVAPAEGESAPVVAGEPETSATASKRVDSVDRGPGGLPKAIGPAPAKYYDEHPREGAPSEPRYELTADVQTGKKGELVSGDWLTDRGYDLPDKPVEAALRTRIMGALGMNAPKTAKIVFSKKYDHPAWADPAKPGKVFVNPDVMSEATKNLDDGFKDTEHGDEYIRRLINQKSGEEIRHNAQHIVEEDEKKSGVYEDNVNKYAEEIGDKEIDKTVSQYGSDSIDHRKGKNPDDIFNRKVIFRREHSSILGQRKATGESTSDVWKQGKKNAILRYLQAVYQKLKAHITTYGENSEVSRYLKNTEDILDDAEKAGQSVDAKGPITAAGYADDFSKSNNAKDAERSGRFPASGIAERLKVPVKFIQEHAPKTGEWHHTSKFYNMTDYYDLDQVKDWMEGKGDYEVQGSEPTGNDTLAEWRMNQKALEKNPSDVLKGRSIKYLEWSGTRNHPKATERTLDNVTIERKPGQKMVTITGPDGTSFKKSLDTKGFEIKGDDGQFFYADHVFRRGLEKESAAKLSSSGTSGIKTESEAVKGQQDTKGTAGITQAEARGENGAGGKKGQGGISAASKAALSEIQEADKPVTLDKDAESRWTETKNLFKKFFAERITDLKDYTPRLKATMQYLRKIQQKIQNSNEIRAYLRSELPEPTTRGAVIRWIEAGGDKDILAKQAEATTDEKLKSYYEAAQDLSPREQQVADKIVTLLEAYRQKAAKWGLEINKRDNYFPHVVEKDPNLSRLGTMSNHLRTAFNHMGERTYPTMFDGEQAGVKYKTNDAADGVAAYLNDLDHAIASRQYIADLTKGTESDGKRMLAPPKSAWSDLGGGKDGQVHAVFDGGPREGEEDYQSIPEIRALKGWNWAGEANGKTVMHQSDLLVHPQTAAFLKKIFGTSGLSAWWKSPSASAGQVVGKRMVKFLASDLHSIVKSNLLLFSPFFHPIQIGTEAKGHNVNPFRNIAKLDFNDPEVVDAMDHTLALGHEDSELNEEARSDTNKTFLRPVEMLADKFGGEKAGDAVRWVKDANQAAQDWIFKTYIPSIKMNTYKVALDRNTQRMSKDLEDGKVTEDQVKYLTAEQVNNAYGELNYAAIERHPDVQLLLRNLLLAPDFFEARTRHLGQAITGVTQQAGREQFRAMAMVGLGMAVSAQMMNIFVNGQMDISRPFEVRIGNRYYGMRSSPGDALNFFKDAYTLVTGGTRGVPYINNRMSPMLRFLEELRSGENWRGEKVGAAGAITDFIAGNMPMVTQSFAAKIPVLGQFFTSSKNNPVSPYEQVLTALGVKVSRYSPITEIETQARDWVAKHGEEAGLKQDSTIYPVSKYRAMRYALEDEDSQTAFQEYQKLVNDAKGNNQKVATGFQISLHHPFTGSNKGDELFAKSLDAHDLALFKAAKDRKQNLLTRFQEMIQQQK